MKTATSEREVWSRDICFGLASLLRFPSERNVGVVQGPPRPMSAALFWPLLDRGEVDLRPLIKQCLDHEVAVSLPFMQSGGEGFREVGRLEQLVRGRFGILEPTEECPESRCPDMVIVPCLGFTERGERIGYGSGFYDRALEGWLSLTRGSHRLTTVLVAFECCRCEVLPTESHDVKCQWLVTECGARPATGSQTG